MVFQWIGVYTSGLWFCLAFTGLVGAALRVYHDGVRIPARLTAAAPDDLAVTVRIQACDDSGTCLAPTEIPSAGINAVQSD
ncbi:MAG: protein-disulfide reductase DsbD family protein [Gammaproteobacteria bacterium]|nr:protein-disulfide reductase DsbD family protein [Gammaproteobacteria bacterium]